MFEADRINSLPFMNYIVIVDILFTDIHVNHMMLVHKVSGMSLCQRKTSEISNLCEQLVLNY